MEYTDCVLEKISINTESFIDDDGNPISCWEVIERILKLYNVKLKQKQGKYFVVNYHELNSPIFQYDFSTLTLANRVMSNNIVDITSNKFSETIEQQKVKPLKGVKTILHTKIMGTTEYESSDWSYWYKHFYGVSILSLTEAEFFSNSTFQDNYITLNSKFTITKVTSDDYLKITFDHYLKSVVGVGGTPTLNLKLEIQKPDGTFGTPYYVRLLNWWTHFESPLNDIFKITESGDYNIKLTLEVDSSSSITAWTSLYLGIKNITINFNIDPTNKYNLAGNVYDKVYYQFSYKGIKTIEEDSYFTDFTIPIEFASLMENENGVYVSTGSKWNRYLNGEQRKLIDLYSQNILNNRATYKNYLRCKIYDRNNIINYSTIIVIEGKYYLFVKFDRNFKLGEIDCSLIELETNKLTYDWISEAKLKTE